MRESSVRVLRLKIGYDLDSGWNFEILVLY